MTMRNTPDLNADSELDIVTGGKLASDLIPLSPTDVVKDRLRRRLLHRVAVTAQDHAIMRTVRAEDGLWRRIAPGAEMKALYQDGRSHAFLIRLEPGATLQHIPMRRTKNAWYWKARCIWATSSFAPVTFTSPVPAVHTAPCSALAVAWCTSAAPARRATRRPRFTRLRARSAA